MLESKYNYFCVYFLTCICILFSPEMKIIVHQLILFQVELLIFNFCFFCRNRNIFLIETSDRNWASRENSLWCFLCGCHHLFRMFLYVPHSELPFPIYRKTIFEIGLLRHRLTHNGFIRAMVVLWILLPFQT